MLLSKSTIDEVKKALKKDDVDTKIQNFKGLLDDQIEEFNEIECDIADTIIELENYQEELQRRKAVYQQMLDNLSPTVVTPDTDSE